jgi:hypothetical protein
MFQTMYRPRLSSWLQLFKSIEWQLLSLCLLLSGLLSALFGPGPLALVVLPGLATLGVTMASCALVGVEAARKRSPQWGLARLIVGGMIVSALHLIQPWARSWGRVRGWLQLRNGRKEHPRLERMWGNLSQRDCWLRLLAGHLTACGWICRTNNDWESVDLVVTGPGTHEVRLTSVYEEVLHKGFHWVRFRVTSRRKFSLYLVLLGLSAAIAPLAIWPTLLPLLIPLSGLLHSVLKSREHMESAVAQAAQECGEALDMPSVDAEYTCLSDQ